MKVIYRISNSGYKKVKPSYIGNEICLRNAIDVFHDAYWYIIADNVSADTLSMINEYCETLAHKYTINTVSIGHGAGTFNLALNEALKSEDEEIIYFLENDYLHEYTSYKLIQEGFELNADYISLYDHPDKYIPAYKGGNPFVEVDGGEVTKVFLGKSCHWRLANSTTMTFAAKVKTLREDEPILRKFTSGIHPHDFRMFRELIGHEGRALITPIPGACTHGESAWLSPFVNWEDYID